jgi:NADH:ubiquinone oxidoreductase subunit F (NADH-binding)
VIEAMTIAALVTGATEGYLYIRHEYHEQIEICREEIIRARAAGLIGNNILGSGKDFELDVFVSPGGYVQGEETALMEAIEGKRGQPRNKPVDVGLAKGAPAFNGLWGKPTIINNVETFAYVPVILTKGPEEFKKFGINGCEGLKWIGVSGDVNQPGVFEVPMGTTYETAIMELAGGIVGGKKIKGFAPSGPSFGLLPDSMLNLKMDWGTAVAPVGRILGSGAIVAVADDRCMLDLALNFTRFYRNESCGKCVPCRLGSQKMVDLIFGLTQGTATEADLEAVPRLADMLNMTSICGLGQVVPSPIKSLLAFFKDEVDAHIKDKRCPAGVCK